MKFSTQILAASTTTLVVSSAASHMVARDTTVGEGDSNVARVCYPEAKSDGAVPPCVSIANIELACQPNGTQPVDYEAHAQCMCGGSYFMDWRGCQNCLFVHGFRSARDHVYWEQVVSVASEALCHASPTADFKAIFSSVEANTKQVPPVTTGETKSVDEIPSKTDVSLYYTATAPQGPGVITGALATVTRMSHPAASGFKSMKNTSSDVIIVLFETSNAGSGAAITAKRVSASSSTGGAPAQETGMAIAALAGAALLIAF